MTTPDNPTWRERAFPGQTPPHDDWMIWKLRGGRGSGKSRGAAETIKELLADLTARDETGLRVALLGDTLDDVRRDMLESCLLPVLGDQVRDYNHKLVMVELHNGTLISGYASEFPDKLRGPLFHIGWIDQPELFPVLDSRAAIELEFALKLGPQPKLIITTEAPRPGEVTTTIGQR